MNTVVKAETKEYIYSFFKIIVAQVWLNFSQKTELIKAYFYNLVNIFCQISNSY